jgi:large subunit ribosomal protein L24
MRIKKGDTVYIRTGEDRGKKGRVLIVDRAKGKILVEGINMRKRSQRPTQKNPKGGVISIEAPVHISNVGLFNPATNGPTKTGVRLIEEAGRKKKVRISKETGEEI